MMGIFYVLDDSFKVSEVIERMSDEEREKQAKIWEKEGRREKEKIQKRKNYYEFGWKYICVN